jgi:hypothetical protein
MFSGQNITLIELNHQFPPFTLIPLSPAHLEIKVEFAEENLKVLQVKEGDGGSFFFFLNLNNNIIICIFAI